MKAIILAAGEGTRMRPLTLESPKPLLDIGSKKIIDFVIESLPDEIGEVILVVDYLKEKIIKHLEKKNYSKKIAIITQREKKGTFGALLCVKKLIKDGEKFMILNSDDIHDKLELEKYIKFPRSFGIQKMVMPNYYSVKTEDGFVIGFEKQSEEEKMNGAMIATGAYVLDSDIFRHPGIVVHGDELGLPQTILAQKELHPIKTVVTKKWFPINTLEDLERARKNFA
jgi:UDP-N-acetylglucosamine diphosphorylase / glucose-1-phosphate thymidylyltransferase / UDP-N-acetylgalactosamine diphosphorylase / glucosamine-1-phosphate N-acetyltransferase / galactosamine-1-phosphate N-acetyltransferase